MGDTRYWMWTRRRFGGSSKVQSSVPYYDSWEEQAFAEDSSGLLGGCIWPPRSYSCTFCRREFRSAQALGGHMNVHRRDRARLRQSPNSQGDQASNQNPCGIMEYPHEVCSFPCPKPNPNPNPILTTPLKPIAPLSTFCNQNSLIKNGLSISSNCQKLEKSLGISQLPNSPRINNSFTVEILTLHDDQKLKGGMNCDMSKTESTAGSSTELVFGCRKRSFDVVGSSDEEDGEMRKRLRNSTKSSTDIALPLFLRQSTVSSHDLLQHSPLQRGLFGQGTPVIEELDLELRLGQRPEVK